MAIILVVVVLAVVAGVVFAMKSKGSSEAAPVADNVNVQDRLSGTGVTSPASSAPRPAKTAAPATPPTPEPAPQPAAVLEEPDDHDTDVDEVVDLSRFGVATDKPKTVDFSWPTTVPANVRHLEGSVPEPVDEPEPVAVVPEPEPVVVPEPEPVAASEHELLAEEVIADEYVAEAVAEVPEVIDLVDAPPTVTAPVEEPVDNVDRVLDALIDRARQRHVGVAEVAAELVEQAELEDREIDEVLSELVGRTDDDVDPSGRLSELTLFNDDVPRRPGELTQFSELNSSAKKRVIIRVLCLLVAHAEEQKLQPRDPRSDAETRTWPLSRAVWPVPVGGQAEDEEPVLPARR